MFNFGSKPYPQTGYPIFEILDTDKHSSKFVQNISNKEKSFITFSRGVNVIKRFFLVYDALAK